MMSVYPVHLASSASASAAERTMDSGAPRTA